MVREYGFLFDGQTWVTLAYPGATSTYAMDTDGHQIVGCYILDGVYHSFLYDSLTATYTTFDYPGARGTYVTGLSGQTIVGGYYTSAGVEHGFVAVVPLPGAVLLGMLGLGVAGMKLRRS